jgi:RimJ/RimL family protein N-acetyltransferase
MRHDIILDGYAFRLRPIGDADAKFVISLRSNPQLNRYLHPSSNRVEDQLDWFAEYYRRPGDYYFVLERKDNNASEGVVSVYNIDTEYRTGEWGRWIIKPGSIGAVESALLIYRVAFERLHLHVLYCRTMADNAKVVSFHDSCGIIQRTLLPLYFDIDGRRFDAVEHQIDTFTWAKICPRLEKLAQLTARRATLG